jgi:hypothetical protein
MFSIHIADQYGCTHPGYPERRRTLDQVLDRIADPPDWTDCLLVFDERTGCQLAVAFRDRPLSRTEHRPILDLLAIPDEWIAQLAQRSMPMAGCRGIVHIRQTHTRRAVRSTETASSSRLTGIDD